MKFPKKVSLFGFLLVLIACGGAHITATDIEKDQVNARLAAGIYNDSQKDGGINPAILRVKIHAIYCNEQGELIRTRSGTVDSGIPCK
jgi:hypothetical protein